jgi:hypothetical protein
VVWCFDRWSGCRATVASHDEVITMNLRSNRLFDTDVKGGPRLRRSVPFAAGQLQR